MKGKKLDKYLISLHGKKRTVTLLKFTSRSNLTFEEIPNRWKYPCFQIVGKYNNQKNSKLRGNFHFPSCRRKRIIGKDGTIF